MSTVAFKKVGITQRSLISVDSTIYISEPYFKKQWCFDSLGHKIAYGSFRLGKMYNGKFLILDLKSVWGDTGYSFSYYKNGLFVKSEILSYLQMAEGSGLSPFGVERIISAYDIKTLSFPEVDTFVKLGPLHDNRGNSGNYEAYRYFSFLKGHNSRSIIFDMVLSSFMAIPKIRIVAPIYNCDTGEVIDHIVDTTLLLNASDRETIRNVIRKTSLFTAELERGKDYPLQNHIEGIKNCIYSYRSYTEDDTPLSMKMLDSTLKAYIPKEINHPEILQR